MKGEKGQNFNISAYFINLLLSGNNFWEILSYFGTISVSVGNAKVNSTNYIHYWGSCFSIYYLYRNLDVTQIIKSKEWSLIVSSIIAHPRGFEFPRSVMTSSQCISKHQIPTTVREIRYINLYLRRAKQPTCKLRMTLALHPVLAEQPAWYSGQQACLPP